MNGIWSNDILGRHRHSNVDLVADRAPEGSGAEQLEKKSRDQKRSRMETGPHGVSGGGCGVVCSGVDLTGYDVRVVCARVWEVEVEVEGGSGSERSARADRKCFEGSKDEAAYASSRAEGS